MNLPLLMAVLIFLTIIMWVSIIHAEKENNAGWGVAGMVANALAYAVIWQIATLP